jgi:hypothetical protein
MGTFVCGALFAIIAYVTYTQSKKSKKANEVNQARIWFIVSILAGVLAVISIAAAISR